MISKEFVVDFVTRTKTISEEIKPSFFELTVAMAFDYFEKEKVDIAVIETGLGGRLDSTNIITPILSIITNIGYDHMDILGNTLEKIAAEKAGIIKPNVPVVIGEYLPETKDIFIGKAVKEDAPIHFAQEEFTIINIEYTIQSLCVEVIDTIFKMPLSFKLDLNGLYQAKNLCTVLSAVEILIEQDFSITDEDINAALGNIKKLTGLYGRWDVIAQHPKIILDVAHNEDGFKQLLQQLSVVHRTSYIVHFVIGMVKDKDVNRILSILPKEANYYFSNAHIARAMPHQLLKEKAAEFNLQSNSFDDVNVAIGAAKSNAAPNDIIVVCGSVFLVAEVDTGLFAGI
jgi:dihydrofolate synthase/folylpolyglutamate synthase